MTAHVRAPSMHEGEILAGRFRIERVVGVGSMGVVIAASEVATGKMVALKLVVPGNAPSPAALERFVREARDAMRLQGDHVARVLDVGALPPGPGAAAGEPGAPYVVLEYLEGHDLASYAHGAGGKLPIAEACDVVLQACEAIAEAAAIGLPPTDLDPERVLVTTRPDGRPEVKVLDLGITRFAPKESANAYASPERLQPASDRDRRAEVWSLGVILYELLAGALPFPADSPAEMIERILHEPPVPLHSLRVDAPNALDLIVMQCLEKDRAKRFHGLADLARVLEPLAGAPSGIAARVAALEPKAPRSGRPVAASGPRPRALIIAAILLAIGAIAAFLATRGAP